MRRETRRTGCAALAAWLRNAGVAVAAVGLAALAGLSGQGSAQAAAGSLNQITGAGSTASGITVNWTSGLLDANNQAITTNTTGELAPNSDRAAGTGPLNFMYDDPSTTWFKSLQVKVSQTKDIRHQGINVSWTGGGQTITSVTTQSDFLQMMECYGDASTGPSPEGCEFGAQGLLPSQAVDNPGIAQRTGDICVAGATPNPSSPPTSINGDNAIHGCDPYEPGTESPSHYAPPCTGTGTGDGCDNTTFSIPFVPADGSGPEYGADLNKSFNAQQSNEVQQATTDSNGTGQQQFEALTSIESSGLGCGADEDNGQVRNCWLVIVPRGEYEPNGFHVTPHNTLTGALLTSPLSAANWAMRIQIHLDYAPDGVFCQIGTPLTHTAGTQLITRAMQSWIVALAQKDNCSQMYSFAVNSEPELTTAMTDNSGVGLGFTTIPVGTEGLEDPGESATKVPKMLYAPVAVVGLGFGFNINEGDTGFVGTSMKLTPNLLAKALTQVYLTDLPDYAPSQGKQGPTWAASNPVNITFDSEWANLNPPTVVSPFTVSSSPLAPLVLGDRNALVQQIWQWVRSDSTAASWLNGTVNRADNVAVDPDYKKLKLGTATPVPNSFPRVYQGTLDVTVSTNPVQIEQKNTGDLLPVVNTFDAAASDVLIGNNPTLGGWDFNIQSPTGSNGWWDPVPPQAIGQRFIWGLADTSSMAAYGLIPATLCKGDGANGTGTGCVSLSEASITAALKTAKADSSGLLHVDPAKVQAGAYPLVDVVYAAVETSQSADLLNRDAELLSFAAGDGQATGTAPGDLPPGYLPLPANLAKQTQNVAAELRKLAGPAPTPTGSHTTSGNSSTGGNSSGGSGGSGTGSTNGGTSGTGTTPTSVPGASAAPAAASTASASGPTVSPPPTVQLASGTTPRQKVGDIRWVIIIVVIAGLASAGAGITLRSGRLPTFLRRAKGAVP